MTARRAGALSALALLALAGCKPAVRGLCNETSDCRDGARCSLAGICLANSGTCAPVCADGEICSRSTCVVLKPVTTVKAPAAPLSPAQPKVTVRVDASPAISLHALFVEVDSNHQVASGAIDSLQDGDNLVTLTQFEPGATGTVSVRATLRYQAAGASSEEQVSSVAVPAVIDASGPSVSVFIPAVGDTVNGWVPRTADTLEVRATVDDGAGTGAQSATLSFDVCPASGACTYPGAVLSQAGGAKVFSFLVPRSVQAAGSEAPLPVTITATDGAANQGHGAGVVKIDDAAPQVGNVGLVSTPGVGGEDGNLWVTGGDGAPDVEIAVPVSDGGAGVASLTLHLTDVAGPDPAPLPQSDGTVHFVLSPSRVQGREGGMHFTLTATDALQHSATPLSQIWVDDVPPVVTLAKVNYLSAAPAGVCAADLGASNCGRTIGTLLRDDTATVTFDVQDCGSGIAPTNQMSLTTMSGGQSKDTGVTHSGKSAPNCTNGNQTHHYSVQLNFGTQAPALDPADSGGVAVARLVANGVDKLGHRTAASPGGATTGDGVALLSLWRWRRAVAGGFRGAPALLSGNPGARPVVVATDAATANNLYAIAADGSLLYLALLVPPPGAEIAVDTRDAVYAVGAVTTSSTLNIVKRPSSPGSVNAIPCSAANTGFINPAAIGAISGKDVAVIASGYHASTGSNLWVFQENNGSCQKLSEALIPISGDFTGVTLLSGASFTPGSALLSENRAFSSIDQKDNGFDAATVATFDTTSLPSAAPPSIAVNPGPPTPVAIFATESTDQSVHKAAKVCGASCNWQEVTGFTAAKATANLSSTPVFDANDLWTVDDAGKLYAWSRATGAALSGFPIALPAEAAPPVLLQGGSALVVQKDGAVKVVSPAGLQSTVWGNVGSFGSVPVAPVVDTPASGVGGLAYVPAPGFVYALHVPLAPMPAGASAWPRPGRDSCNSRNAGSPCQ